jgi:murein DD-endopeptidase MepM/ murein hydrolase activator NlpD
VDLRLAVCLGAIGCADPGAPASFARLAPPDAGTRFGLPIADPTVISSRIGVDHDPQDLDGLVGDASCRDYLDRPFPNCYDEHHGTDFLLKGGFEAMDAGSVEVLAAADGRVVEAVDGHYDRCHGEITGVSCDGHPIVANAVVIEHADGLQSLYWHLKKGSVAVEVGQEVACGDVLGLVGSSGISSLPHLHFGVEVLSDDDAPRWIDPYAGPRSQDRSLWEAQGADAGLPEAGCTSR